MHFVRDAFLKIKSRREVTKVAVIGIGQSLRGDDAAGLEAVHQWRENFPETAGRPEVQIEACELPGLALLDTLNEVDAAILVDAVQSSGQAGTIYRLDENEIAAFTSESKSAHGWGVAETLQLGSQLMRRQTKISIIGINSAQTELGTGLSEAIKEALPKVCEILEEEINNFIQ
jgi:hydrogenase maturation protease